MAGYINRLKRTLGAMVSNMGDVKEEMVKELDETSIGKAIKRHLVADNMCMYPALLSEIQSREGIQH